MDRKVLLGVGVAAAAAAAAGAAAAAYLLFKDEKESRCGHWRFFKEIYNVVTLQRSVY